MTSPPTLRTLTTSYSNDHETTNLLLDLIMNVHLVERGDCVNHLGGYGEGVVVARDQHGAEAFVKFESGLRWVPQTSLSKL